MDKLTEESKSYFALLDPLDLEGTLMKDLRQRAEDTAEKFRGDLVYAGTREETNIAEDELSVPVTVLKPNTLCENIMVYFHGGGWTWCSRKTHLSTCEMISQ